MLEKSQKLNENIKLYISELFKLQIYLRKIVRIPLC
jgi:hypothetical protein